MIIFEPFEPDVEDEAPVNELGEEIERRFIPGRSPLHNRVPERNLVVYTPSKDVSQLQVRDPGTDTLELDGITAVISIDGACRDSDTHEPRSAWGVYFGPESPYNASGRLNSDLPQTRGRAEIEALSRALDIVYDMNSRFGSLIEIYIVSESEYLVRAMSEWMDNWIEEDGNDAQGCPVAHFEALKEIYEYLEDMTEAGLFFKFWHVMRENNPRAEALMNKALGS